MCMIGVRPLGHLDRRGVNANFAPANGLVGRRSSVAPIKRVARVHEDRKIGTWMPTQQARISAIARGKGVSLLCSGRAPNASPAPGYRCA